jgi:light-harvesting protein B-800-850 alpha chain
MNNAKLWLVVKPTVGIPVFLSAVAISSFLVHLLLVLKTGWMEDYYSGSFGEEAALTVVTDTNVA